MNHWIILPILIPAVTACLVVLTARYDQVLSRIFALAGMVLLAINSGILVAQTWGGLGYRYELGNWPVPFGIELVLDPLAAWMVALASLLGLGGALAAIDYWDQRGRHFHSLLLLQMMGVNGAFLTGDLFNLFVFFEVSLISAYGLVVHGGGKQRLRGGLHYVVINLVGSTLFLIAVGLIYGVTGELNYVAIRQALPGVAAESQSLLNVAAVLMTIVFGLKAGLVPFHFWLPAAYGNTSPLVAAVLAVSTKVGAVALIRWLVMIRQVDGLVVAGGTWDWLMIAGGLTMAVGMLGILAARGLRELGAAATLGSSGTLVTAIALRSEAGLHGAIYYLIHSTLAGAVLFLLIDVISRLRAGGDNLRYTGPVSLGGLLGGLFFVAAAAMLGLPPLGGFIGKLQIMVAGWQSSWGGTLAVVVLATTWLGLLGFARAGSQLFWKSSESQVSEDAALAESCPGAVVLSLVVVGFGIAGLAAWMLGAGIIWEQLPHVTAEFFPNSESSGG